MKIAIAQMNPTIGDIITNAEKALIACNEAKAKGASLIIFPELYLCGYPPKDLLLREDFLTNIKNGLELIAKKSLISVLMGAPYKDQNTYMPYNAAFLLASGSFRPVARKRLLPNYNVFDEKRYFATPKDQALDVFEFEGKRLLISICEDVWNCLPSLARRHDFDPVASGFLYHPNIDIFVNISASPYSFNKPAIREQIYTYIANTYKLPVLVAGQTGANDQLLFDGHSLIVNKNGQVCARAKSCEEDLLIFDTEESPKETLRELPKPLVLMKEALCMGIRDYVQKCSTKNLVLGLSGGIDSAVAASLAVSALGPKHVFAFFLPSRYSSKESYEDAHKIAKNLGISCDDINIEPGVAVLSQSLQSYFAEASPALRDIAEQNLQARLRFNILMGITNAKDCLLLNTSNKSEIAVGYGTLYGDMSGAISVLGDVYKTEVWRLAHLINQDQEIIPQRVIDKAPTAELAAGQLDTDTLPPYPIIDQILRLFIDEEESALNIQRQTGIEKSLIDQVINMIARSEFKRRQAPLALMVSEKVFGDARRLPVAKRQSVAKPL